MLERGERDCETDVVTHADVETVCVGAGDAVTKDGVGGADAERAAEPVDASDTVPKIDAVEHALPDSVVTCVAEAAGDPDIEFVLHAVPVTESVPVVLTLALCEGDTEADPETVTDALCAATVAVTATTVCDA